MVDMSEEIDPAKDRERRTDKIRVAAPVGVLVTLGTMLVISLAEPAIRWILIPSALLGVVIAVFLHFSVPRELKTDGQERPEIQMAKIPVTGVIGIVFTIGTMAIFFTALPQVRWFLLLALPLGAVIGFSLHLWHRRRPLL